MSDCLLTVLLGKELPYQQRACWVSWERVKNASYAWGRRTREKRPNRIPRKPGGII
jgi:hypothetical protein